MPTPNGLLKGSKCDATHTTIIDDAVPLFRAAKAMSHVKRVRPSFIRGKGNARPRVVFFDINGGVKMVVHGRDASQDIYIYTSDAALLRLELLNVWKRFIP